MFRISFRLSRAHLGGFQPPFKEKIGHLLCVVGYVGTPCRYQVSKWLAAEVWEMEIPIPRWYFSSYDDGVYELVKRFTRMRTYKNSRDSWMIKE